MKTTKIKCSPRVFVLGLLTFVLFSSLDCLSTARAAPATKPNIIFIMVDDLGKEWISAYGAEGIKTPAVDKLASAGLTCHNVYSMPQCTPTRVTLLTGRYPFNHGWVNHWDVPRWGAGCHFDPKHNLAFPRLLKKAGYATAAAGKWQINDFRVQPNFMKQHGFDEWCMWTGYETGVPASAKRYWDPYINTNGKSRTHPGVFGPDVYTSFLINFMKRNKKKPFFLYFPMVLTHGPLVHTPAKPKAAGKYPRQIAMVEYTDILVGRLLKAVDDLGLAENTITIFTTDNGSSKGVNGKLNGRIVRGGKASIGENGTCMPFIIHAPGRIKPKSHTNTLIDFTDLFPTFLEIAGTRIPANHQIDGRSFASLIHNKPPKNPRQFILSMGHGPAVLDAKGVRPVKPYARRAIRDKRYKAIVDDRRITHLFDLKNDPAEKTNLVDSDQPNLTAALKKFNRIIARFPKVDARPKYNPTPPQPWDRKPSDGRKKKKRSRSKKRS